MHICSEQNMYIYIYMDPSSGLKLKPYPISGHTCMSLHPRI